MAKRRLLDAESAVAEALVAKVTGRAWLSNGDVPDELLAGDVEGGLSVRWSPHRNASLILHPDDPDELIGVLVTGRAPNQHVAGWIQIGEGKKVGVWRTDVNHPAFFVAASYLQPIVGLAVFG